MVVHMLVGCVSELKNLFKSSDSDGVRRQARGALQALGVAMETASATGTRVNNFTSSGHPGATSAAIGNGSSNSSSSSIPTGSVWNHCMFSLI